MVVWSFFGIAFLWDWNENWPFPVLWPQDSNSIWVFQICWYIECNTFTASCFRIWNSSTGIHSLPLALFVLMLPKDHLTSGSRWMITPSWLSGSWRSFLYNSFVYSSPLLYSLLNIPTPMRILSFWKAKLGRDISFFFLNAAIMLIQHSSSTQSF